MAGIHGGFPSLQQGNARPIQQEKQDSADAEDLHGEIGAEYLGESVHPVLHRCAAVSDRGTPDVLRGWRRIHRDRTHTRLTFCRRMRRRIAAESRPPPALWA